MAQSTLKFQRGHVNNESCSHLQETRRKKLVSSHRKWYVNQKFATSKLIALKFTIIYDKLEVENL